MVCGFLELGYGIYSMLSLQQYSKIIIQEIAQRNRQMYKQKSERGGSSQGDRTFDFKYNIDISDRRGKTGETFRQQQGFDFEDFKDFREDKSQKSFITSQRKVLPSQLVKRSEESFVITQNPTEISIKRKGGSFVADDIKQLAEESQQFRDYNQATSPKFNNQKIYRTVTNNLFSKTGDEESFDRQKSRVSSKLSMQQPFVGRMNQSKRSDQEQSPKYPQEYASPRQPANHQRHVSYNVSTSRVKPNMTSRLSPELQYKDLLASIQYYESQNDKLDYETKKILDEIERYQNLIQGNPAYEHELMKLTDQTNTLNTKISTQRSLERTLIDSHKRLQEEFDQIVMSIEGLKFQRPLIIKDEAKAIIDEINSLKAEFQALKRDEGSLNLSTTLQNPLAPSIEARMSFLPDQGNRKMFNPQQTMMKQSISQILQCSKDQPNYIYNIKMMTMKDQWKIFQNSQICINCSTRDYPILELRIGNKSAKNLIDFTLRQEAAVIAEREVLQSKCYYIHSYRMTKISHPFLRIIVGYKTIEKQQQKNFIFFIPTLLLKHGQFIPITRKQYEKEDNQHQNVLEQVVSFEKPIDTTIIKEDISQFLLFYPNLLFERNDKGQGVCKGIFRLWNSSEGSLVRIKQRGSTVAIYVKNNIPFLLQSLEFLLTILI